MPICPHCNEQVNFENIKPEVKGSGFLKEEIL